MLIVIVICIVANNLYCYLYHVCLLTTATWHSLWNLFQASECQIRPAAMCVCASQPSRPPAPLPLPLVPLSLTLSLSVYPFPPCLALKGCPMVWKEPPTQSHIHVYTKQESNVYTRGGQDRVFSCLGRRPCNRTMASREVRPELHVLVDYTNLIYFFKGVCMLGILSIDLFSEGFSLCTS